MIVFGEKKKELKKMGIEKQKEMYFKKVVKRKKRKQQKKKKPRGK